MSALSSNSNSCNSLCPSISRSLCSTFSNLERSSGRSSGPMLLVLPDLTIPSLLRTPTRIRRLSRLRDCSISPQRSSAIVRTPCSGPASNRGSPCNRRYINTPQRSSPRRNTPLRNTSRRNTPRRSTPGRNRMGISCGQFPSPLFCSSPTQAVPLFLPSPASPHCPSPIRNQPELPPNQPVMENLECVVRIAGRRLFESGYSIEESPNKSKPTKDKVCQIYKSLLILPFLTTVCLL